MHSLNINTNNGTLLFPRPRFFSHSLAVPQVPYFFNFQFPLVYDCETTSCIYWETCISQRKMKRLRHWSRFQNIICYFLLHCLAVTKFSRT